MIQPGGKKRWQRLLRRKKRQVEDIGSQAEQNLERLFIKRLGRLWLVKRFLISWCLLLVLLMGSVVVQSRALSPHYQKLAPIAGGTYVEGILGSFTNANPLYAAGGVDGAVAKLLFAGLFKYDEQGKLVGDLASRWEVNGRGTVYTVHLKPGLTWHDGVPLTAHDVAFTYRVIQNPDARSPLAGSWHDIKVEAIDDHTVTFSLPNSLSAFPYSMTNGIVPRHKLEGVPMGQLRSVGFNTLEPTGAGPFRWEQLEVSGGTPETREQRIALVPFAGYHAGKPKLSRLVVRAFTSEETMINSFKDKELNGMAGLSQQPDIVGADTQYITHAFPLTSAVMVFFKNSHPVLSDAKVRRALVMASDTGEVRKDLQPPVIAVHGPLLKSHLGYNPKLNQYGHDPEQAQKLLDEAGWTADPSTGLRSKDNQPLKFALYTKNTGEYQQVTQKLQEQWQAVGAQIEVLWQSDLDLQATLSQHNYDALLYGISLGSDPDVFAYWHSSQADLRSLNQLNLSEYKSTTADTALEAGRTRAEADLRAAKYEPFLQAWRDDAPALALYQPNYLYVTDGHVHGLEAAMVEKGIDRFANVHNWMIRQGKVLK